MGKPKGWMRDSARHSLAARGVKTRNIKNARMEKAKQLSASGQLDWGRFQDLFYNAEAKLESMINDGLAEIEGEELEENQRVRYGETKIEIDNDGELKAVVIDDNSKITLISKDEDY